MAECEPIAPTWGSENPHSVSPMKTELIWDGNCDECVSRCLVRLLVSPLAIECIETVDNIPHRETAGQTGLSIGFWALDLEWRPATRSERPGLDLRTRREQSPKARVDTGWQCRTSGQHHMCVKVTDDVGMGNTAVVWVST
jgi:hypothetical protein